MLDLNVVKLKLILPKVNKFLALRLAVGLAGIVLLTTLSYLSYKTIVLGQKASQLEGAKNKAGEELQKTQQELEELKNQDQLKINQELKGEIKNIQKTYATAVVSYEELLDLKDSTDKTEPLDKLFADALTFLSKQNYSSASATLTTLNKQIEEERTKIATTFKIPENIPTQNAPPGAGYSRQKVTTDAGVFMVSIVAADLGNTRVIVDTASDGNCSDNCPVLPLATYVSRNNAFAAVNGSYFCPATYPSCAGKANSFDTLLMNKNKVYFNSDNNVYSNVPAVIFGSGYIRFVSQSLEWGRDTGIDSMIANRPLLVQGGNIVFTGGGEAKEEGKGGRSFVANKGNTVYIGVVHNATVAESAKVMQALGMENALNLDDGGSVALWSGGYKVGPGRDLPNAVLFVKK